MGKRVALFRRVTFVLLVVGLALGTFWLIAWASDASATLPPAQASVYPRQAPSPSGTVRGTVLYSGTVTGTHLVWVGAFTGTLGLCYHTQRVWLLHPHRRGRDVPPLRRYGCR